jgi:hypothetical protein
MMLPLKRRQLKELKPLKTQLLMQEKLFKRMLEKEKYQEDPEKLKMLVERLRELKRELLKKLPPKNE